jgi:hypothetical protein
LASVRQRLIPDLDLERLGKDEPEEHDRDQAGNGELPQEAEPWQADADPRRAHDDPSL